MIMKRGKIIKKTNKSEWHIPPNATFSSQAAFS